MDIDVVFFSLTTSLPYPMVATDGNAEDPRIIFANEAFEELTGYELAELRGKNPNMLQGEKTDRRVLDQLKESLRERKYSGGSTYNYRKNGEPCLLKWCIKPVSAQGRDFFVAIQQELNQENSGESMVLHDSFVVSLTRNLIAFYRNSLSIYQHFHQELKDEHFSELRAEEMIDIL